MQKKKKKMALKKAKITRTITSENKTAASEKLIAKKVSKKPAKPKQLLVSQAPEEKPSLPKIEKPLQKNTMDLSAFTEEQIDNYKKWLKFQKQYSDKETEDYSMARDFEIKTPLKHKVHGWGVVVQRRDNYIDVLFEMGMKTLIVNYK